MYLRGNMHVSGHKGLLLIDTNLFHCSAADQESHVLVLPQRANVRARTVLTRETLLR